MWDAVTLGMWDWGTCYWGEEMGMDGWMDGMGGCVRD